MSETAMPSNPRPDPLSAAWRFLAAPQTLMAWLGLLALVLALAALQTPLSPPMSNHPEGWLASGRGSAAQTNNLLQAIEPSNAPLSLAFQGLLALTMLSLLVRAVDGAEFAWRACAAGKWTAASLGSWGAGRMQCTIAGGGEPDSAMDAIRSRLGTRGYRWSTVPGLAWPNAVASRRPAALWLRPVAYGAALIALVGISILNLWGWQHEDWQPSPGQTLAVGHGLPYEVQFQEFTLGAVQSGRLPPSVSRVAWLQEGETLKQAQISNGRPSLVDGVAVRQVGFAPVVKMRAWDSEGRLLALQPVGLEPGAPGEIEIGFPSLEAQPYLLIPALDEAITLAFELDEQPTLRASRIGAGGAQATDLGALHSSGTLEAEGLRLLIDLDYQPILRVDHRPGVGLALGALALVLACLLMGMLAPARILWIAAGPDGQEGSAVQVVAPAFGASGRWLARLTGELGQVVGRHD